MSYEAFVQFILLMISNADAILILYINRSK